MGRDGEFDGHHHPSVFPACGLLRIDAKLWLRLASDTDFDKYGFLLVSYLPDDGEGFESIFFCEIMVGVIYSRMCIDLKTVAVDCEELRGLPFLDRAHGERQRELNIG